MSTKTILFIRCMFRGWTRRRTKLCTTRIATKQISVNNHQSEAGAFYGNRFENAQKTIFFVDFTLSFRWHINYDILGGS